MYRVTEQRESGFELVTSPPAAVASHRAPHDLRHSCVALLVAQKIPAKAVQELLGHSSFQFTMDTYGYLFDEVRQETADQMKAVLDPPREPVAVNPVSSV